MGLIFPAPVQTAEAPKPPVEVIKTSVKSSCNDYRDEVSKYDWEVEIALKIMELESGCNKNALNNNPITKDYSVGLFQINLYGDNAKHRPPEQDLRIPEKNIAFAYELYKENGFHPWTVYSKI